jgi:hypothetical protein
MHFYCFIIYLNSSKSRRRTMVCWSTSRKSQIVYRPEISPSTHAYAILHFAKMSLPARCPLLECCAKLNAANYPLKPRAVISNQFLITYPSAYVWSFCVIYCHRFVSFRLFYNFWNVEKFCFCTLTRL